MLPVPKGLRLSLAGILLLCGTVAARTEEPADSEKKAAVVIVRLPADAELTIEGFKSKNSGEVREFDTPPLTPGKKFSYRIKAAWTDNGKAVTRETTAIVQAGETTEINLLTPPRSAKKPAPEPEKKPEPEPEKKPKPEPKKKPAPEPEKKLEAEKKPEPEKKPIRVKEPEPEVKPKPEPEKKPKPEPEKKPQPKPLALEPKTPTVSPAPPAPPANSSLRLVMPETLTLQPGETKLLPIKVVRTDFKGPVTVKFAPVPPGLTIEDATVAAGKQKVYVEVTATKETVAQEMDVKVVGVAARVRQESILKIKVK